MESSDNPIRAYRQRRNLTLEAFGLKVGLSKNRLCEIEAGAGCSPEAALRIERETGGEVRVEELVPALRDREIPL